MGEQTQMRPVESSAALGGGFSRLIDGRDVESQCEGTYAHIWIMGWYHVTSGLLLTWMRTMVPTILNIGALYSVRSGSTTSQAETGCSQSDGRVHNRAFFQG